MAHPYWCLLLQVFVGENKDWKLGVVSESAQRKGLFDMSPSCGYYALWWSSSHLRALTVPPLTKVTTSWSSFTTHQPVCPEVSPTPPPSGVLQVKSPTKLRQVGVFLDVDEGQVTFYNSKTGSEIYSFNTQQEFTEKMFPLLGTGDKEVPLVLVTAQHHMV